MELKTMTCEEPTGLWENQGPLPLLVNSLNDDLLSIVFEEPLKDGSYEVTLVTHHKEVMH